MSGTLYIVATPIGHLSDITLRALDVLKSVDYILAEDTRVTQKLLNHYNIQKTLISYPEEASLEKNQKIISELLAGSSYALVSDAGTPAISDPGSVLVRLARDEGLSIVPIPGASAVSALMSVFGERAPAFHFWGFWPPKLKKRKHLIELFQTIEGVHVFFESPYRIKKTLEGDLSVLSGRFLVGRELTKKFESFYGGKAASVLKALGEKEVKGEIVVAYCHKDD